MKRIMMIAALSACMTGLTGLAANMTPAAQVTTPKTLATSKGMVLPYRFAAPATCEAGKKYPLVILLHGAGERGSNNVSQLQWGATELLDWGKRTSTPFFFAAPQCPAGQQWVDTPWALRAHKMPPQPSAAVAAAFELIAKLRTEYPIDPARIYITGISMGGYGTWDMAMRHPEIFAAAVPVCGGGDTTLAWKVRTMPIWVFHGARDGVVPPCRARSMVAALWEMEGNVRYDEYPTFGHDVWRPAYARDDLYEWLFKQHK